MKGLSKSRVFFSYGELRNWGRTPQRDRKEKIKSDLREYYSPRHNLSEREIRELSEELMRYIRDKGLHRKEV